MLLSLGSLGRRGDQHQTFLGEEKKGTPHTKEKTETIHGRYPSDRPWRDAESGGKRRKEKSRQNYGLRNLFIGANVRTLVKGM